MVEIIIIIIIIIIINNMIRYYTSIHKILKKPSLGEYSNLRKKNHFNLGNQKRETLGVKKQGKYAMGVREVCLW